MKNTTMSDGSNYSNQSIKKKFIQSVLWLGSGNLLIQLISWAATIFVIRLLSPADYGLMAMSAILLSFLMMVCDLGMGSAIVRMEQINQQQLRQLLGIIILINIACMGITLLSAPLIAAFFGEPRVVKIIQYLSINFILITFYALPASLCTREMEYKKNAQVNVCAQVLSSLLTVGLALYGFGVWSLVFSGIAYHMVRAIGFNVVKPTVLMPVFSFKGVGQFVQFGAMLTVDRTLFWAYGHLDGVILGRLLGKELLGLYSVALNLASIPVDRFLPILTQVSFTAYSRIQTDYKRLKNGILNITHVVALIMFPACWGMIAVAPELLPLLLGNKWESTVLPFQIISIVLPLKALSSILSPALFATGRIGVNIVNKVIAVCIMTVAFVIGVQKGIVGLCLAWVIAYPFVFLIINKRALSALQISLTSYLRELWLPLVSAGIMVGGIFLLKAYFSSLPRNLSLLVCIPTGVLIYVLLVISSKREFAKIKHLIGKPPSSSVVKTTTPVQY